MVKSAGFHGFHGEIRRISWWNPPDFMNVSFWVMIKYRSFYRKTNEYALHTRLDSPDLDYMYSTSKGKIGYGTLFQNHAKMFIRLF